MPTSPPPPPNRSRDRDATARAILSAAKSVLADAGFQSFGINAIARRAACDKQLIYRYYGGLDGLAEAIGADLADDLTDELKLFTRETPATYGALMKHLAIALLELLRRNRLMQRINAWEAASPSPLVGKLIAARAKRIGRWMFEMRGALTPPEGIDAPAINAIIVAAVQQLVISAAANGEFSGMPLRAETDWQRLREAIGKLVESVYGA